jgi:hypothetical protein
MPRLAIHVCPECSVRFTDVRKVKYCSKKCRAAVKKRQDAAYERKVKRPPHLYREKKTILDEEQLELPLDSPRTDVYEEAS